MSLPRVLWLENGEMRMDVPEEIERLRYRPKHQENIEVQSDSEIILDDVNGNSLEIKMEFENSSAAEYGIKICCSPDGQEQTVISYNPGDTALKVDTNNSGPEKSPKHVESAPLKLTAGERLQLRIFIDRSVVEVFANNRQAIMRRIYPKRSDSTQVRVFAKGNSVNVRRLESWHISPSNPY